MTLRTETGLASAAIGLELAKVRSPYQWELNERLHSHNDIDSLATGEVLSNEILWAGE